MNTVLYLAAILLPLLGGGLLFFLRRLSGKAIRRCALGIICLTSVLVWALILFAGSSGFLLLRFTPDLAVEFRLDALGRFFAGILATLWPLTTLYADAYMEREPRQRSFFSFFTISYAVSLGIALAGNLFTLYFNYEMLTLATMPLVLHPLTRKAVKATRTYLLFSMSGAAFAFASMIFLISNGAGGSFTLGGVLTAHPYANADITRIFFVLGFFGFGVKAAVFPLHVWLPKASVAPTPVTALLHAVAVVKAGAFAVMRLCFFCYSPELLRGTWAQLLPLGFICFTMVYGSVMAQREDDWKRRLAYSTVSNLSYILFGVLLLIPEGLYAGLIHMAAHACVKILAFFCAGAVLRQTGITSQSRLGGMGRRMPVTFACFTVSALALTGIPPLNGFISKWYLLLSAAHTAAPMAWVGVGALLISALITAIYMLIPACRAWFPGPDHRPEALEQIHEADWRMKLPNLILAAGCVLFGCWPQPILEAAARAAGL